MAHNRVQMEAEMMRFEQEISLPPASAAYRPPMSFIPQQVMRQHQAPFPTARPPGAYSYGNWNAANAPYGAYSQQQGVPQQVPTMYGQTASGAMWPGQAAASAGEQASGNARADAKWKPVTRTVVSASPNVISAPPLLGTTSRMQIESAKPSSTATKSSHHSHSAASFSSKPSTSADDAKQAAASSAASGAAAATAAGTATGTEAAGGGSATTKKKVLRTAAGKTWEDPTLADWDPNDFRIFVGDLGNEATDEMLARLFNGYASFQRARVVRDPRTNKVKGYGFASFRDPKDFLRALKEVNGRYCGNRPVKLSKSVWKERALPFVRKREKEKKKLGMK